MEQAKQTIINFFINYGMQIVGALIILGGGFIVARWLGKILQGWLERKELEPPVRTLIVRVVRLLVMAFTSVARLLILPASRCLLRFALRRQRCASSGLHHKPPARARRGFLRALRQGRTIKSSE